MHQMTVVSCCQTRKPLIPTSYYACNDMHIQSAWEMLFKLSIKFLNLNRKSHGYRSQINLLSDKRDVMIEAWVHFKMSLMRIQTRRNN